MLFTKQINFRSLYFVSHLVLQQCSPRALSLTFLASKSVLHQEVSCFETQVWTNNSQKKKSRSNSPHIRLKISCVNVWKWAWNEMLSSLVTCANEVRSPIMRTLVACGGGATRKLPVLNISKSNVAWKNNVRPVSIRSWVFSAFNDLFSFKIGFQYLFMKTILLWRQFPAALNPLNRWLEKSCHNEKHYFLKITKWQCWGKNLCASFRKEILTFFHNCHSELDLQIL